MKKSFLLCAALLFSVSLYGQTKYSAKAIVDKAVAQGSVIDTINYINSNLDDAATAADKRTCLFYMASMQEQLGLYTDASVSYAKAAGIAAGDAKDMQKVSSEQLVIDAVRCALCSGDYETAESYLNSSVRSSSDPEIMAFVNLYSVWAVLCHADSIAETEDSISLLKAYSQMQSMNSVKSSVLLTLWYLTDDQKYADQIKKEFPKSAEYGIVTGKVQIMTAPFWYFVPRAVHNSNETPVAEPSEATVAASKIKVSSEPVQKAKRQQLGLFKSEDNAKLLIEKLKAKGFAAYSYTETRSSGTKYFIVVVDENTEGTMGLKLRDAGFECYPVVE